MSRFEETPVPLLANILYNRLKLIISILFDAQQTVVLSKEIKCCIKFYKYLIVKPIQTSEERYFHAYI